jgi:hypothetical protein
LTFNEQKNSENRTRNQRFRDSKKAIEQLFSDGKITDADIEKKEMNCKTSSKNGT